MSGGQWTVLIGVVAAALAFGCWFLVWGGEKRNRTQRWVGTGEVIDVREQPKHISLLGDFDEARAAEIARRDGEAS